MRVRGATALASVAVVCGLWLGSPRAVRAQGAADQVTAAQVKEAIDVLGAFEFPRRMAASRTVRRAAPALAVPALTSAVSSHADRYVRFRALVILSGFNDPRTREVMLEGDGRSR